MSIISSLEAGKRLDLWLSHKFPKYSRSSIRKLLDAGSVKVNGEIEYRPNYRLKEEDNVLLEEKSGLERVFLPATKYKKKLTIAYQDEHILIVDKPIGVRVHPISTEDHDTLLNYLYYQLQGKLSDFGVNLVNRIDKETSGLVVCALSAEGAHYYGNLFSKGELKKRYLAAVHGNWLARKGFEAVTDSLFLNYNHLDKVQEADLTHSSGEYAQTTFKFIDYSPELKASLLEVVPLTGRTHQIRIHLKQLGFPILGDTKYEGRSFSRLMLHSYKLNLIGMNGEEIKAKADIPVEFSDNFDAQT